MSEKISYKKWGVDLFTTEELEAKLSATNATIADFKRKGHDTPLTRQVIKMRDAIEKELALRNKQP